MLRNGFNKSAAQNASSTMLLSNKTTCYCKQKLAMLSPPPVYFDWPTVLELTLMNALCVEVGIWQNILKTLHSCARHELSGRTHPSSACLIRKNNGRVVYWNRKMHSMWTSPNYVVSNESVERMIHLAHKDSHLFCSWIVFLNKLVELTHS